MVEVVAIGRALARTRPVFAFVAAIEKTANFCVCELVDALGISQSSLVEPLTNLSFKPEW